MTSPSVVAHFETLHREMANYNRASEALERERVGAVEKLQELQKQQMIMERASQELSDKVGQFHRQKTLLQNESNRLQTLLQQERMELEECTRREDEMLTEERRKKTDFCRSMAASNDLLGKQLLQQEEQRWMRLIGISSIDLLPTEEAAVVSLKEVTGRWECQDSRKQLLMENIRLLRRKALIKQESLSENHLLKLEDDWRIKESCSPTLVSDAEDSHKKNATHLQIFYGVGG